MKIAVGMSGGVDSTMAVQKLRAEGHEVVGLTMQIWDGTVAIPASSRSACFGPDEPEELARVRALAERLGIQHVTVPLADEYKAHVLDYFCSEYLAGRTPNPCVRCNHTMKFGFLIDGARRAGVDFDLFATGHYARVAQDPVSKRFHLRRAAHRLKDQSYFLAGLTQAQLGNVIFPLGEWTKTRVRDEMCSLGLADVAAQPESQDFIACADYGPVFGERNIVPGPILDRQGNVLGEHRGIIYYTVGQRKGLELGGRSGPLYVLAIDPRQNAVIVGPEEALFADGLVATALNWIAIDELTAPRRAAAQIRLRSPAIDATLTPWEDTDGRPAVKVTFASSQRAVTPGQAVVFYAGDVVLGGGWIKAPTYGG